MLLFDIGGGSSELVRLERSPPTRRGPPLPKIKAWVSLPVGVVTLAERHGGHLVTPEIYAAMIAEVAALLDRFLAEHGGLGAGQVHLLGTSGTVTTIAGVHLELRRYERRRVDGCWMVDDEVTRVIERLLAWSYQDRVANRLHWRRARRSRARGLRHPRRHSRRLPLPTPAGGRPRAARGDAGADDARGRRVGR